jgi:hypothetical protein
LVAPLAALLRLLSEFEGREDWIRQFAEALEMPELWGDIDSMLQRR